MGNSVALSNSSCAGISYSSGNEKKEEAHEVPAHQMLCADVWKVIFDFATNDCRYGKTLSAIRGVCREWYNISDSYNLRGCWRELERGVKSLPLQGLVDQVNQMAVVDRFVSEVIASAICPLNEKLDESEQTVLLNRMESLDSSSFSQFSALTRELRKQGAPIPDTHAVIGLERSAYESMQQRFDKALEMIWECIQQQIDFEGISIPASAQRIREWLGDPVNAHKIARITILHLSSMKLTVLPPEIGLFSKLTELYLPINRLASLPKTIGNLSELRKLYLSINQLRSLPSTIGDLSQLTEFNLAGNQLASLPSTIGNLFQLRELNAYGNRLTSLPSTIGNLSQLTELNLYGNQLKSFPETVGNLSQLRSIHLDGNPLIFILDKDLNQFCVGKVFNYQEVTSKLSASLNYACRKPLASLCQMIDRGEGEEVLKGAFQQLSDEMRQRIHREWTAIPSSSGSSFAAGEDFFADRTSFVWAVMAAIQGKWQSLSAGQRHEAYAQVSILAEQLEEDADWGKAHAEENIIRLIDAMELIHKNQSC